MTDVNSQAPRGRADVVEQLMRVTDDDLLAISVPAVDAGTPQAAAAAGRIVRELPGIALTAACPLTSWAAGRDADPGWRLAYPPRPGSLFAELEQLTELYGGPSVPSPGSADSWDDLLELRALAASHAN